MTRSAREDRLAAIVDFMRDSANSQRIWDVASHCGISYSLARDALKALADQGVVELAQPIASFADTRPVPASPRAVKRYKLVEGMEE